MTYGIGIVYGLGTEEDSTPEIHALNKLLKLRDMIRSGEAYRGILTSGKEVELIAEYFVREMEVPRERVYVDRGRSFVSHMYHIRRMIDRWIRNGEIRSDVLLHHLVSESKNNHMSVKRAEFDADWIIPTYPSRVHGVEDGRPEKVIWEIDGSKEPERMRIDKRVSNVPLLSTYRPDIAQYVAIALEPSSWKTYWHRLLPGR